jgi:hypothetical protein
MRNISIDRMWRPIQILDIALGRQELPGQLHQSMAPTGDHFTRGIEDGEKRKEIVDAENGSWEGCS